MSNVKVCRLSWWKVREANNYMNSKVSVHENLAVRSHWGSESFDINLTVNDDVNDHCQKTV